MKESLRRTVNPSLFRALRIVYRWLRQIYRNINPFVYSKALFNNYSPGDRRKSNLPGKINYLRPTALCYIMKSQGTDKALYQEPGRHNYTLFYDAAFRPFRHKPIRLFEMGIGTTDPSITHNMGSKGRPGASLRGWKEYFPQANIYAADIDTGILFEEERIKTYYVDQLDGDVISKMWEKNEELRDEFDVIIDDGLHTLEANKCFLEHSIHKLKSGGFYIVEDVHQASLPHWEGLIKNAYRQKYPGLRFTLLNLPNDFNAGENAMVIVEKLRA